MPITVRDLILLADQAYDTDGLVLQYHDEPTGQHGDGLARFIAIELAETFDADADQDEQLNEAYRVMQQAVDQLNDVLTAFCQAGGGWRQTTQEKQS